MCSKHRFLCLRCVIVDRIWPARNRFISMSIYRLPGTSLLICAWKIVVVRVMQIQNTKLHDYGRSSIPKPCSSRHVLLSMNYILVWLAGHRNGVRESEAAFLYCLHIDSTKHSFGTMPKVASPTIKCAFAAKRLRNWFKDEFHKCKDNVWKLSVRALDPTRDSGRRQHTYMP